MGRSSPPGAFERAKTVVDASMQLCQWLLDHEQGDVPGLIGVTALVSQPPDDPRLTTAS